MQTNSFNYHAQIPIRPESFYTFLLWPLVKVKKIFALLYDWILQMVWSELIEGERDQDEIQSLIAFFIFCALSLAMYHLRSYDNLILGVAVVIWLFDYLFSIHQFKNPHTFGTVSLQQKEKQIVWKQTEPGGTNKSATFLHSEIKGIFITNTHFIGGAFQEIVGSVWLVKICLFDGAAFVVADHKELKDALAKAQKLEKLLKVPIKFSKSEGNNKYAETPPGKFKKAETVKVYNPSPGKFQIYTHWSSKRVWEVISKVLKKSGFFLFLLIMTAVMIRFGKFVNAFVGPYLGLKTTFLYIDLSPSGIWSFFRPNLDWKDILELSLALALIIYQGWRWSQKKHVFIDKEQIHILNGKSKIAQLKTSNLDFLLFTKNPEALVLATNYGKVVDITDLHNEQEYRLMLLKIEEAVANVRHGQS